LELDTIGNPFLCPITPGDCGPLRVDIEAKQSAVGGKPAGEANGAIAGEGADFDGGLNIKQLGEESKEIALLGADEHAGDIA